MVKLPLFVARFLAWAFRILLFALVGVCLFLLLRVGGVV